MHIFLILVSYVFSTTPCPEIHEVRYQYDDIRTEKDLLAFIAQVEAADCVEADPYMASAIMQKAQFALAPWTKYRYFLKGKAKLEDFIRENPENVDARYVRFLVQSHVPAFLGYKKNLVEDSTLILKLINQSDMRPAYKNQILYHIENLK